MMVRSMGMVERPVPAFDRREPLLSHESTGTPGFGEMAGTSAAACAAVCCCCPCGLAGLVVLAVVKVPAGLCRKAIRRKRKNKKSLLLKRSNTYIPQVHPLSPTATLTEEDFAKLSQVSGGSSPWEDEMLMSFHTGFWRNPSIRSQ